MCNIECLCSSYGSECDSSRTLQQLVCAQHVLPVQGPGRPTTHGKASY